MRHLSPGENFIITRQLGDPSDASTYYVRAVIRWANGDTVINFDGNAFINLTDSGGGSQRFRGTMRVPQDQNGGQGSWLTITTTVYTDSGYTDKALNYEVKEEEYLVQDRRNPYSGMGGGGINVDYDKVRRIVKEEQAKVDMKPLMDGLSSLKMGLSGVEKAIKNIEIPEPEKVNLEPVLEAIRRSQSDISIAIKNIPEPEKPEKVDLEPLKEKIDRFVNETFPPRYEESLKYLTEISKLLEKIKSFFKDDLEEIKESTDSTKNIVSQWVERAKQLISIPAETKEDYDEDEE
ncbi:MAG: hypothetical protein [Podoviridae sp. ctviO18]|nr:MAG: hypothetical protein [Podoviridae sp. ctviO18]